MTNGLYIVLEGLDCSGKSTLIKALAEELADIKPLTTAHPGSTPLGKHLRKLTKTPEEFDTEIELDTLSEQLLLLVDNANFVNSLLIPTLNSGRTVLADRCNFISGAAYGLAGGLDCKIIEQMYRMITTPKANRVYIMQLPWELAEQRSQLRGGGKDRFDHGTAEFRQRVAANYDNFKTNCWLEALASYVVDSENIIYLDATLPTHALAKLVEQDIRSLL